FRRFAAGVRIWPHAGGYFANCRRNYRPVGIHACLPRRRGGAARRGRHPEADGNAPVSCIRDYLSLAGKRGGKVSAVFGVSPERCAAAVRHLRRGAPDVPVWLFTLSAPDAETAALCERVVVGEDSLALLIEAEKLLWPHWMALGVATWTGEHGRWPMKLAPFFTPPFRTLLMNEHGDFFAASPAAVYR